METIADPADTEESYLELDVEPENAQIYIDDDYRGRVDGWHDQVIPIEAGPRRIELRADGYITQRFDADVNAGRWITLRVRLEPIIDAPGKPTPESEDDALSPPPRPNVPDPD